MATAERVIKASLHRILVQGSEAPLEADEYQGAIETMNDYMAALEADGVHLGYTVVYNLGDGVTIPGGALRGLKANLAIELAPDYGGVVSAELIQQAVSGMKVMRKLGQRIRPTQNPSTLPIGSGNRTARTAPHFYPGQDSDSCQ